jgi:hypothetical protein
VLSYLRRFAETLTYFIEITQKGAEKPINDRMKKIKDGLVEFTKHCREDMHEPDNEGITATVIGGHLDNAFGARVFDELSTEYGEFVVRLIQHDENENVIAWHDVNLADLIALARKAQ